MHGNQYSTIFMAYNMLKKYYLSEKVQSHNKKIVHGIHFHSNRMTPRL